MPLCVATSSARTNSTGIIWWNCWLVVHVHTKWAINISKLLTYRSYMFSTPLKRNQLWWGGLCSIFHCTSFWALGTIFHSLFFLFLSLLICTHNFWNGLVVFSIYPVEFVLWLSRRLNEIQKFFTTWLLIEENRI